MGVKKIFLHDIYIMEEDNLTQVNKYTTKVIKQLPEGVRVGRPPPKSSSSRRTPLSVERELQRFAQNEYMQDHDDRHLLGTGADVPDPDHPIDSMFLTNAVTENKTQDDLDKKRYLKEVISYLSINSLARNIPPASLMNDQNSGGSGYANSLFSTGGAYGTLFNFAPYEVTEIGGNVEVLITATNNHMRFSLQDWSNPNAIVQVLSPSSSPYFDVYVPINIVPYDLIDLQTTLQTSANLVAATGTPLDDSSDPNHMFTFDVSYNPNINPDRVAVQISSQSNFKYAWDFYSLGNINTTPIAQPIPATDAAYVVQDPASYYPYPNSYALDLIKSYSAVKSIRVIKSKIPNTSTIINRNNNHITLQLINKTLPPPTESNPDSQNIKTSTGSINWDFYIPYGNYDVTQLLDQMETQINTAIFAQTGIVNMFTLSYNQITGAVEFTTNDPYAFKWNFNGDPTLYWQNLYDMLGFENSSTPTYTNNFNNLISVNVGTPGNVNFIQQPFKAVLLRKSVFVWMQLNNYETIHDSLTDCYFFCGFSLEHTKDNAYAVDTFVPSVHVFSQIPLSLLSTIDVQMYDELGNPYEFNGIDHSFILEIVRHEDHLVGTGYDAFRGVNDKTSYVP